jgi:succinate dehydrogenase / fumarate reductase cytochrome b subunit
VARADAGYGFELGTIYASGWTVVAASTALTVVAWFSSFVVMG